MQLIKEINRDLLITVTIPIWKLEKFMLMMRYICVCLLSEILKKMKNLLLIINWNTLVVQVLNVYAVLRIVQVICLRIQMSEILVIFILIDHIKLNIFKFN